MIRVLDSYSRAHRLLWRHGLWRYLLVPLVVAPFLLAAMGCAIYFGVWHPLFAWVDAHWLREHEVPRLIRALLACVLAVLLAGPGYVLFRGLLVVCYAPFMDRLVSGTIRLEAGGSRDCGLGLAAVAFRTIWMTAYTTGATLLVTVVGFGLGFIPVIGPVVSLVCVLPLSMFLCAVPCIDPCMERYDRSAKDALRLMWRHRTRVAAFGAVSTAGMLIPLVGWFASPTYSLVAGVILGMELEDEEEETRNGSPLET